ncbi:DUF3106 domain-containing protein [Thiomonas sp.]
MATRPDRSHLDRLHLFSAAVRATLAVAVAAVFSALAMSSAAMADPRGGQGAYQRWEQMPPQQRERILQEQQRFKRLPPGEQERLRREYDQQREQRRRP